MAKSPDGRGVLLLGGQNDQSLDEDRILELHARADSWSILNITMQNGRRHHVVYNLQ